MGINKYVLDNGKRYSGARDALIIANNLVEPVRTRQKEKEQKEEDENLKQRRLNKALNELKSNLTEKVASEPEGKIERKKRNVLDLRRGILVLNSSKGAKETKNLNQMNETRIKIQSPVVRSSKH